MENLNQMRYQSFNILNNLLYMMTFIDFILNMYYHLNIHK